MRRFACKFSRAFVEDLRFIDVEGKEVAETEEGVSYLTYKMNDGDRSWSRLPLAGKQSPNMHQVPR